MIHTLVGNRRFKFATFALTLHALISAYNNNAQTSEVMMPI